MIRFNISLSFAMISSSALLLLSCLTSGSDAQQWHEINPWNVPTTAGEWYEPLDDVKVGDVIQFVWNEDGEWSDDRNVYLHPSGNCWDDTDARWIGASSGTSYTTTDADAGTTLFFVSNIDSQCDDGLNIEVNVAPPDADVWTDAPTNTPTNKPTVWVAPSPTWAPTFSPVAPPPTPPPTFSPPTLPPTDPPVGDVDTNNNNNNNIQQQLPPPQSQTIRIDQWIIQEYEPIEVNVGDVLEIPVGLAHDVFLHPTLDCTEDGRVLVGEPGSLARYEFTPDEAGTQLLFVCDVGGHCEAGMQLLVTVNGIDVAIDDDVDAGNDGDGQDGSEAGGFDLLPPVAGNGNGNTQPVIGTGTDTDNLLNDEDPSSASSVWYFGSSVAFGGIAMVPFLLV